MGRTSNTALAHYCTSLVVGLHFGRPCYLRQGSGQVCLGTWRFSQALGGLPPRLLPPSGRLGLFSGAWGALNKGNANGAACIFGNARRVWALVQRPDPPKKSPVPHLPVRWGEYQIPQSPNTGPLQLSGRTSAGRVYCSTHPAECISTPGDFLRTQGPSPQAFTPFGGGRSGLSWRP